MDRYFLADIIGDGSDENEFRPSLAVYPGLAWDAPQPADSKTGRPLNNWCLVRVSSGDVTPLLLDLSVDPLPAVGALTPLSQIDSAQMAVMRSALTRRGIGTEIVDLSSTLRDVLDRIALRAENPPGAVLGTP